MVENEQYRRRGESLPEPNDQNRFGGLGELQEGSEELRENQNRADQGNSERGNPSISVLSRREAIGKIFSQLKELRDEYDSYTNQHKQRLEARLDENKERRDKFFAKADELEREIMLMLQDAGESESDEDEDE